MISVIIPTYNRANLIGKTLESVLNQTHKDLEVIVIDDGSSDRTKEVVQEYSQKTSLKIHYYYKNNGGCASARNEGLKYAHGDYIAFLDSDDRWLPATLENLVKILANSPADFVYSPSIEVMSPKRRIIKYPCAENHPENFAIEHFLTSNCRHGGVLYRQKVFEKVPGFREDLKYNEDSDFLQRVAIDHRAAYCPFPGFEYYHHDSNKSKNRVGIYQAMLTSCLDILTENPEFKQTLAEKADQQIEKIKINLNKALIKEGRFTEAVGLNTSLNLAIKTHSKMPIIIAETLELPRKIATKIGINRWKK